MSYEPSECNMSPATYFPAWTAERRTEIAQSDRRYRAAVGSGYVDRDASSGSVVGRLAIELA